MDPLGHARSQHSQKLNGGAWKLAFHALWRWCRCSCALAFTMGARFQSPNFTVDAATPELAQKIAKAAEKFRPRIASSSGSASRCPTGRVLARSVPSSVQSSEPAAKQVLSSIVAKSSIGRCESKEPKSCVLDSVLPHEVTHTIFGCYFRRPLPRWADEGACTTMKHLSERSKQHHLLYQFLRTNRGIAFSEMFVMEQYPEDILPLYAQGYSLARFFIQQGGRRSS